jgi:hypothetical protein
MSTSPGITMQPAASIVLSAKGSCFETSLNLLPVDKKILTPSIFETGQSSVLSVFILLPGGRYSTAILRNSVSHLFKYH